MKTWDQRVKLMLSCVDVLINRKEQNFLKRINTFLSQTLLFPVAPLTCCSCSVSRSLWLSGWLGISFSFSSHLLFSSSTRHLSSSRLSRSCRHGKEISEARAASSPFKLLKSKTNTQFHNRVYSQSLFWKTTDIQLETSSTPTVIAWELTYHRHDLVLMFVDHYWAHTFLHVKFLKPTSSVVIVTLGLSRLNHHIININTISLHCLQDRRNSVARNAIAAWNIANATCASGANERQELDIRFMTRYRLSGAVSVLVRLSGLPLQSLELLCASVQLALLRLQLALQQCDLQLQLKGTGDAAEVNHIDQRRLSKSQIRIPLAWPRRCLEKKKPSD